MREPIPLPDGLSGRPFSVAEAAAAGVERNRLRRRDLVIPFRGIRTAVAPGTLEELALAYTARMTPGQFFSHLTSATLLGSRVPEDSPVIPLHVSAAAPATPPRGRWVVGHESSGVTPITLPNGLVMAGPVDSWIQLATALTVDELVVMADGLVRRTHPFATLQQLRAAVAANSGRRGQRRLVSALRDVRAGTESARETLLRLLVVRAGFPEPEVTPPTIDSNGSVIARGELTFPQYRTILQCAGELRRADPRQFAFDERRADHLVEQNWRVIRIDNYALESPTALIARIDAALRRAGWRPAAH